MLCSEKILFYFACVCRAIGLLIVIQILLIVGIIVFTVKWKIEVYAMHKEAYLADREDAMKRRRRASEERKMQQQIRAARQGQLSPSSITL